MGSPIFPVSSASGGSGAIIVPDDQFFADTTERDAYFVSNPSKLVEGAQCVIGTTSLQLQEYRSSAWIDMTPVVRGPAGSDGAKGDKGDDGEFPVIHTLTEKTTPVSADVFVIEDSAASYAQKKVLYSTILGLIPDQLSDLSDDATHRLVTDTLISTWNAKQAALGYTAENTANKGAASGYAPLGSDTKIPSTYLPAISITSVVVSETEPVSPTEGMVWIRVSTSISKIYDVDTTTWYELGNPGGYVTTVNGISGPTVSLNAGDIPTVVTNFNGLLSSADTDVQKALDTIDNITIGFTNYKYVAKNGNDSTGDGSAGKPYLTISAAITANSSGTVLIIMPGTYVENITFKAGVYLTSPVKFGVYITGNHVCSFSGTVIIDGIILQSATGDTLTTSGANVFNLQILGGSSVNSGSGHAINWQATNASARIYFEDGTCNVTTSGASACCVYSTTGAAGYIIANRVSFQLNSAANIALSLGGALAFTHTSDVIYGQVVISGTASAAIALVHMTATGAAVLTTNSSGATVLTEAVITTNTSPAIAGAGIFAFMALTYTSTGVGGAATLNGGAGASPLTMAPVRLRSSTLLPSASVAAGLLDGTFEHDSTGLYWTQGTTRVRIDIPVINELTAETSIADGDFVVIFDISAGAVRKMTKANFVAGISSSLPVADTTALVKGSVDATKLVRIEADGIATGTTRVITMPDFDVNLGTIPTSKAAGSDIITGTDDAKYLTSKALKDAAAKRSIFLSLSGGWAPTTTLPDGGFVQTETSTNKVNFRGTNFTAVATDAKHEFGCIMPGNYDGGTITAKAVIFIPTSTDASNHTIIIGLQGVCFADGDAGDTAYGTAQEVTIAAAASLAGKVKISAESSAITLGNTPGAGKWTQFRCYRKGDDTYTGDVTVLGWILNYGINKYSDV